MNRSRMTELPVSTGRAGAPRLSGLAGISALPGLLMIVAMFGTPGFAGFPTAFAAVRDPFAPPGAASCLTAVPQPGQWRLQGIIGREEHYRGWLRSPQGRSVAVATGSAFPVPPWRIGQIYAQGISLHTPADCEQQPLRLQLKGRVDEKDSDRPAVVVDQQQPRQ